jgi:hypothetical protein
MTNQDPLSSDEKEYMEVLLRKKLQTYTPPNRLRRKILKNIRKSEDTFSFLDLIVHSPLHVSITTLLIIVVTGTTGYYAYKIPSIPVKKPPVNSPPPIPPTPSPVPTPTPTPIPPPPDPTPIPPPVIPQIPKEVEPSPIPTPDVPPVKRQTKEDQPQAHDIQEEVSGDSKSYMKDMMPSRSDITLSIERISDFKAGTEGSVTIMAKNTSKTRSDTIKLQVTFEERSQILTLPSIPAEAEASRTLTYTYTRPGTYTVSVTQLETNIRIQERIEVK